MAEEVILTANDLMTGPPSPVIPRDLAPRVLDGVDTCSDRLRALFECLHANEVEPFCQDHIIMLRRCTTHRDEVLRARLVQAEGEAASSRSAEGNQERVEGMRGQAEQLERRLILASGVPGPEGFQTRWRLHGELQDTKARMKVLEARIREEQEQVSKEEARASRPWWRIF
ncbi:hypothetical protein CLOM_g17599 [Closterium sp. NIES-68]|nr:hypothetical protein CLOM_g17599 [Closterium sp. NIES-68]